MISIEKSFFYSNRYDALCQRGEVKVWRDNNKDNILDWEGETDTGYFGINIHRAGKASQIVDKNGVQVVKLLLISIKKLILIDETSPSKQKRETFTYTLLTEKEVGWNIQNRVSRLQYWRYKCLNYI